MQPPSVPPPRALAAAVIGLGALLLFAVQPLVARAMLPRFGGTALVWSAAVVTFQALLLAGYAYAHAARRWRPAVRRGVHGATLVAGVLALCLAPVPEGPSATTFPALSVVAEVLARIGLPAFALAASGPLTARILGGTPYRLYALSNAASLAALLAYPTLVEPRLALSTQRLGFAGLFALYAALTGWLLRFDAAPAEPPPPPAARIARPRLRWLALSAAPAGLFLAVTQHLCVNIAPAPLLWVLPLALYLLSLILAFDRPRWYRRAAYVAALPVALGGLGVAQIELLGHTPLLAQLVPALVALFVACMAAHGELAALRPADPPGVTAFYLLTAVGGVVGGAFVSLAAPSLFDGPAELPLLLLATGAAVLWAWRARPHAHAAVERAVTALLALYLGLGGVVSWAVDRGVAARSLWRGRNAYACLRVAETPLADDTVRSLIHGTIRHGAQRTSPARRHEIATYYRPSSGVGRALGAARARGPVRLGVVGLGTGSLADALGADDAVRFYEIDGQVEGVARRWFFALPEARARVEVALGDGRLALAAEPDQRFDVLALDAFNSDAVPTHLLTREAFALYRRHLAPRGVLAVNISNHYVNLEPVIAAEARAGGWDARLFADPRGDDPLAYASTWALLARTGEAAFEDARFAGGAAPQGELPPFTDEWAPLFPLLRWE